MFNCEIKNLEGELVRDTKSNYIISYCSVAIALAQEKKYGDNNP